MKKTILQFTCMNSNKYGALESYFLETAQMCMDAGYHSCFQYESKPCSSQYITDLEKLGSKIVVQPIPIDPIRSFFEVLHLIRKIKPVVIHVHFAERFVKLWIPILAKLLGVKRVVSSVHNILEFKNPCWSGRIYNLYDDILAVSRSAMEACLLGGATPAKVKTHYLGLFGKRSNSLELRQEFRIQFGIPDDAIVIAIIAFDTPFKRLDILLNALRLALVSRGDLHLIQIGIDPVTSDLPKLTEELGIARRVHWAGIVDFGWRILNAADLYMQTSRFSEGLGLAIIEAMALKLPVIGTNIGGIPEAVDHQVTGIIVEPDPVALARAIIELCNEKEKMVVMGEAGFIRYKKLFEGSRSVENLVRNYYGIM